MFERYTESARRTLFFSRFEASRLGSRTIDPVHFLLGLIRDDKGVSRTLLLEATGSLDDLVKEIEGHVITGPHIELSVEIPFGASSKRILNFTVEEADALDDPAIRPEHLLLGLLREDDPLAGAILFGRGLRLSRVREQVRSAPRT